MIYIHPRAEPFYFSGGNTAILFIHGFTASPSEIYQLAQLLHQGIGITASGILLPGHGSHPSLLNITDWQDWYSSVEKECEYLLANYDKVFVVGLSLGGLLSLYLGANMPDIKGVVAINPPIRLRYGLLELIAPLAGWVKPYFKKPRENQLALKRLGRFAYDYIPVKAFRSMMKLRNKTLQVLDNIEAPLLLIQSQADESVNPAGIHLIKQKVPGKVQLVEIREAQHVVTMGKDVPEIAGLIIDFIRINI